MYLDDDVDVVICLDIVQPNNACTHEYIMTTASFM